MAGHGCKKKWRPGACQPVEFANRGVACASVNRGRERTFFFTDPRPLTDSQGQPLIHPRPRFLRAALYSIPLILTAAVFGAVDRPAAVDEVLAGVVSSVPDVPGNIIAASNDKSETGVYPGFDTYAYPGDLAMLAWKADSHYEWVGYYLPAPCHKDDSWSGKRALLENMGWGVAVIYVGQQTWDQTPRGYETRYRTTTRTVSVTKRVKQRVVRNGKRVTRTVARRVPVKRTIRIPYQVKVDPTTRAIDECGVYLVGATRGKMEAADAIRVTAAEGFARGTVVFLDIERMERTPQAMRDYYRTWVRELLADGRFVPGIYAHTYNAELIYSDVKAEYVAAGNDTEPPFWIASMRNFENNKAPREVGHSFATVWQGKLDIQERRNGVRLPIDVNVAAVPSPSTYMVDD